MKIMRKFFLVFLALFFLAISAKSQTVLINRNFNPNEACADTANVLINNTSPSFTNGWYKCVASVYIAANVNTSAAAPNAYTCSACIGDGVTDDTAAYQALINTVIAAGGGVIYDAPAKKFKFTSTITISLAKSISIISFVDAQNFASQAPQFIWQGSNDGIMFNLASSQDIHIEGHYFNRGSVPIGTIKSYIIIDGEGLSQISTLNYIRWNSFEATAQLNNSAILISISPTAVSNNENMDVSYNHLICSSGIRATAKGIGIQNGANPNAKHNVFAHNGISQCAVGVRQQTGSIEIDHLGGGFNAIDVQSLGRTEPLRIAYLETEASKQGADISASFAPVRFEHCRLSNPNQTNTGGFYKLDGLVSIENSDIENAPPVGGTIFEDVGTGNLSLSGDDVILTNVGLTLAQVGILNTFRYSLCRFHFFTDAVTISRDTETECYTNQGNQFYNFNAAGVTNVAAIAATDGILGFSGVESFLTHNAYWNGTAWKAIVTGSASRVLQDSTGMKVQAVDALANASITWETVFAIDFNNAWSLGSPTSGNVYMTSNGVDTIQISSGELDLDNDINIGRNLVVGSSIVYKSGTPVVTGNGTIISGGRDSAGKITATTTGAASITVTFSSAFTHTPACTANDTTTANVLRSSSTTTVLTIAGTTVNSDVISYQCLGY